MAQADDNESDGKQGSWLIPVCLLDELTHRVTNDLSVAIAALEIARLRTVDPSAVSALELAVKRLQGLSKVHTLLRRPPPGETDLGAEVVKLATCMLNNHGLDLEVQVCLRTDRLMAPSEFAWMFCGAAAELIANALRHGRHGMDGLLKITIGRVKDRLICAVSNEIDQDCGPLAGKQSTAGTGQGSGIIDAIADFMGGRVHRSITTQRAYVIFDVPCPNRPADLACGNTANKQDVMVTATHAGRVLQ